MEQTRTGPAVWKFDSTSEAYDATQCDERLRDGDVLVIESEKVIGLVWTWPFALTPHVGELHPPTADPRTYQDGIFAAGAELAEELARERKWRIVPPLDIGKVRALMDLHPRCGDAIGFKIVLRDVRVPDGPPARERTGWLIAGTTGFLELDLDMRPVHPGTWAPLTNEKNG